MKFLPVLFFSCFFYLKAASSTIPVIELEEPFTPIAVSSRKRKDRTNLIENNDRTIPKIGHPNVITADYLKSHGMEYNQSAHREQLVFHQQHRSLHRQIYQLASKGIHIYHDDLIPEKAIEAYQIEKFSNEFVDFFADILIEEEVENEAKYLSSVIELISNK